MTRRSPKRRVFIITGSRSEFGLLHPVMQAVRKHKQLHLLIAVAGEHLLAPASTSKEVASEFRIDAKVPMQRRTDRGRLDHAAATARGMAGFTAAYKKFKPDWIVVLGDRIEAFAAASAASIAGLAVCHIHGGDRAEGIADEAMRHAITKLAHLHCAATRLSAERIERMGEHSQSVTVTGSPALDGVSAIRPMSDVEARKLGDPRVVVLMHPSGLARQDEERLSRATAFAVFGSVASAVLVLAPNHDPLREVIEAAFKTFPHEPSTPWTFRDHLPRTTFLSLLKRLGKSKNPGVLVGNSSAGLIEAAALRVPVVNIGPRQAGRERAGNVVDVEYKIRDTAAWIIDGICDQLQRPRQGEAHPFGDGRAGPRIAALLAKTDPHDPALLRKRNSY